MYHPHSLVRAQLMLQFDPFILWVLNPDTTGLVTDRAPTTLSSSPISAISLVLGAHLYEDVQLKCTPSPMRRKDLSLWIYTWKS